MCKQRKLKTQDDQVRECIRASRRPEEPGERGNRKNNKQNSEFANALKQNGRSVLRVEVEHHVCQIGDGRVRSQNSHIQESDPERKIPKRVFRHLFSLLEQKG